MRTRHRQHRRFIYSIFVVLQLLFAAPFVEGAGLLYINEDGVSLSWEGWDNRLGVRSITLSLDGGLLGTMSNDDAALLVADAAKAWSDIANISINVAKNALATAGKEDGDVNFVKPNNLGIDSLSEYSALEDCKDGDNVLNPVVYDTYTESKNSILGSLGFDTTTIGGVGGVCVVYEPTTTKIVGGLILLNGFHFGPATKENLTYANLKSDSTQSTKYDRLKAIIVHEMGHMGTSINSVVGCECVEA